MENPGICPRFGSKKMNKIYNPKLPIWECSWECSECGYEGMVKIEDNIQENSLKNSKKWIN